VQNLVKGGCHVQLQIDPVETTWEEHGWVAILNEEGEELARHERAQHNKTRHSDRQEIFAGMCALALASVAVVEPKSESKSESKCESKSDLI